MNKYLQEQDLEINSIDEGIKQYYKTVEERPFSELPVGKKMIRLLMTNVVVGIENIQRDWFEGKPLQNGNLYGPIVSGIPANILALIAISSAYECAFEGAKFTAVAGEIGNAVDRYLQGKQMREQSYEDYRKVMSKYKNINKRKFRNIVSAFDGEVMRTSHKHRMHVGIALLQVLIKYTDFFIYEQKFVGRKKRRVTFVNLKTEVREQIAKEHDDFSILRPQYKPMVVPPKDWTALDEGGYLLHYSQAIKPTVGLDQSMLNEIRGDTVENLYPYLNLIQQTSWCIVPAQLSLFQYFMDQGYEIAGLPRSKPYVFPPMPVDFESNEDAFRNWKQEMALTYSKNEKIAGQRVLANSQLKLANEFAEYGPHYQEWTADSRLRLYPSCSSLSAQSSDVCKGLLVFDKPYPLGEHGYKWMSISLCNNIGEDKISFDDRVAYIEDQYLRIKECVDSPKDNRWWTTWDEPWRGLCAARELVEASEGGQTYRTAYEGRVAACVDGTCNGFQHYAALGRDPIVGKYTNLTPALVPDSIYTHVAQAAIILNETHCNEMPMRDLNGVVYPCHAWRGQIGKDLVKQPTMTTPYSVTTHGVADQIYHNVDIEALPGDRIANINYARDLVLEAIRETATAASDIMQWFRKVAGISARENKNLVWTSPIGVRIVQRYPVFADSSIQTEFHRLYWRDPRKDKNQKISAYKQANAINPNFIHNLDGCHMMMTAMAGYEQLGITSYALNHDSYGVHAGLMEDFKPIINEKFVELHRVNWIERFAEEATTYLDEELPELPPLGTLDIEAVLHSPYLFN